MKGHKHLTVVIKLGTSSIVDERTHEPLLSTLSTIVETAVQLRKNGNRVILVSSGAIGVALGKMDLEKRPKHLPQVQALAAIGQCKLMSIWDTLFSQLRQPIAQILLTRNDIADRTQYVNAQNTFTELLNMGVIPIVNENDTLSVAEIKFGDNDTLSAITAAMISADYLFLMTDVDCLYTSNPRKDPDALQISVVSDISLLVADVSSSGSALGTGGMSTKIVAARLATSAGVTTVITRSSRPDNVLSIVNYIEASKTNNESTTANESDASNAVHSTAPSTAPATADVPSHCPDPPLHTRFVPSSTPIRDRSFWLLHSHAPHGIVYIDEGAHKAVLNRANLLPAGVIDVEGSFAQQEVVRLVVARRLHPLPHRRHVLSKSTDSDFGIDVSEPPTPTGAGTPLEPLTSGGIAGYSTSFDFDAEMQDATPNSNTPGAVSTPTTSASMTISISSLTNPQPNTQQHGPLYATDTPALEVGRALVNYSSAEIARIKGLRSNEIVSVLGYADSEYVALRQNVSLFGTRGKRKEGGESTNEQKAEEKGKGLGGLASFA